MHDITNTTRPASKQDPKWVAANSFVLVLWLCATLSNITLWEVIMHNFPSECYMTTFQFLQILEKRQSLLPNTFLQLNHPKQANGIYFHLKRTIIRMWQTTIIDLTNCFCVFHSGFWYFVLSSFFLIVSYKQGNVGSWLPCWIIVILPFDQIFSVCITYFLY